MTPLMAAPGRSPHPAIIILAFVSLVTAGVAIGRDKERSILLIAIASLTFLLVLTFAVGETLGGERVLSTVPDRPR